MEKLVVNVSDRNSGVVKQKPGDSGATLIPEPAISLSGYKERLASVSVWSDEDLQVFEEGKKYWRSKSCKIVTRYYISS